MKNIERFVEVGYKRFVRPHDVGAVTEGNGYGSVGPASCIILTSGEKIYSELSVEEVVDRLDSSEPVDEPYQRPDLAATKRRRPRHKERA